jgi:hypothetical protein
VSEVKMISLECPQDFKRHAFRPDRERDVMLKHALRGGCLPKAAEQRPAFSPQRG